MNKDYWFFLSHARNDAQDNPWLKKFYEDLARDVRAAASLPSTLKFVDIGFKDDRGIETGTQWTQELATAIQSSKVLVCLFSASYFNSEWCGREFRAFLNRMEARRDSHSLPWLPLIQPVLWDPPDELVQVPQIIKDLKLQATNAAFGEMYINEGLAYILRLQEEKEYQTFLVAFKKRLVEIAKAYPLAVPAQTPSLDTVESAFHPPRPQPSPGSQPASLPANVPLPLASGPEVAWFVYVAGKDQDYATVPDRVHRDCYGSHGGPSWKPYLPPSEQTAGILTQGIVGKRVLRETLPLSAQLVQHLRTAEETNTIVLLIVDPWSIELPDFRLPLQALDKENFINCGVIIIWNDQDVETQAMGQNLRQKISATFSRSIISKQLYLREAVSSEAELEKELTAVINEVQDKIKGRLKLLRPVPGSSPAPFLDVPTGGS